MKFRKSLWQLIKILLSHATEGRIKTEALAQELIITVAESLLEKVELSVFPTKDVLVINSWWKRVRPFRLELGVFGLLNS